MTDQGPTVIDITDNPTTQLRDALYRLFPRPGIRAGVLIGALVKTFDELGCSDSEAVDSYKRAVAKIRKQASRA